MKFPESLHRKLNDRMQSNALRTLSISCSKIDFSSNDYLGLSQDNSISTQAHALVSQLQQKNGATGSRLISGNYALHETVEQDLALFFNAKSGLLFNSGYDANIGLFASVPQRGDVILYDALIHASIRDGIKMSNAKAYSFKHNDCEDLEKRIQKFSDAQNIYVVTESVFSMDGDTPNLLKQTEICEKYNAFFIVDEAHAIGVFGKQGSGIVCDLNIADKIFARVHTFGKAMGSHGAIILGSEALRTYLINFARSFIYTTAIPLHSVATIKFAFEKMLNADIGEQSIIEKLHENIKFFKQTVSEYTALKFIESTSAIHCCVLPGNDKVKELATALQNKGFDVKPILSPTVPEGEERLRICLHSYNSKIEIKKLITSLVALNNKMKHA